MEDKIYELLLTMQKDMSNMQTDILEIKSDVYGIKDDVSGLKQEVSELNQRVTKIETHLENVTDKNIGLIAERLMPSIEKSDKTAEKVEMLIFDVDNLKRATISNSKDINLLMASRK